METRVKISALDTVSLVCPECKRRKILQISEYKLSKRLTRVKSTCTCGKQFVSVIENQVRQNKDIRLAGFFTINGKDGKPLKTGDMVIKRLTPGGLTIRLVQDTRIPVGVPLEVEFVLDDAKQSIVTKKVRVIAKKGHYLTALFNSKKHLDNLGPYLYFNKLGE